MLKDGCELQISCFFVDFYIYTVISFDIGAKWENTFLDRMSVKKPISISLVLKWLLGCSFLMSPLWVRLVSGFRVLIKLHEPFSHRSIPLDCCGIFSVLLLSHPSLWNVEMNWRLIIKIVQAPLGVMLYIGEQDCYWLPRHGFSSDAKFEQFLEIAKSKVQEFFHIA